MTKKWKLAALSLMAISAIGGALIMLSGNLLLGAAICTGTCAMTIVLTTSDERE
jgi:hypothetical protein